MNAANTVRVRFAPSPTGYFHIGGARTALFNWLYARHCGGKFILRIEDTDRSRNSEEALRVLLDGLRWLGLDWDEGPGSGGPYGPYFQSERGEIYQCYLERLRKMDRAYDRDGAVWFRLSGQPSHISDAIRGDVVRVEEKDFVLVRSDGSPTFHFVNVVDDIAMGITHVIRGEDHLSNSSKHGELFRAFGLEPPIFAHIPLILKTSGPGKMSKSETGALVEDYRRRNFLPEAVRNYLCLLGWSPKDNREILSREEQIALFDLGGINRSNARFDEKKMAHVNCTYLRRLSPEEFAARATPILEKELGEAATGDRDYLRAVLEICQEKLRGLDELVPFCHHFFQRQPPVEGRPTAAEADALKKFLASSSTVELWDPPTLERHIRSLAEDNGTAIGNYIHPLRLACSGQTVGPGIYGLLHVLGRERVRDRIERFLTAG
jgi:glutamyl-tRNA synthetase